MKFPGKRKSKNYFPVSERGRDPFQEAGGGAPVYMVGIDQLLVDIEAKVDEELLKSLGIAKGQSMLVDDATVDRIYQALKGQGKVVGEFAGGSVGNTLHNYSVIADDQSFLLGTITRQITVGDYAFHYVRNTSSRVNLTHLHPTTGPMGRAICFITSDGERSFGVSRGIMDDFPEASVSEELIAGASGLVLTAYLLRDERTPIFKATLRAIAYANRHAVPVVISLGTAALVREKRAFLIELIRSLTVGMVAGNLDELHELTGQEDPLLAGSAALEWADLVLLTRDRHGLYLSAWVEEALARETKDPILSKSIAEYNKYEYSRAMTRRHCQKPVKVFSHINPYLGGPSVIRNTNGAGDSALAAVLHDLSANIHHRRVAPTSPKHKAQFLTYSSIHQVCKYANRVSYEVLRRNSPRLVQGLPEREDSLEEAAYWEA
ncbi:MAG: inosine/guanosine kinase [Deltaproteobacteria bacterium]|nr:inosine/guanosine kinase [Deltaproteobacteria bacterium]